MVCYTSKMNDEFIQHVLSYGSDGEKWLKKILSKKLSFDAKRIHKWCFFQTVLSGVWTIDSSKDISHALKVVRALNRL